MASTTVRKHVEPAVWSLMTEMGGGGSRPQTSSRSVMPLLEGNAGEEAGRAGGGKGSGFLHTATAQWTLTGTGPAHVLQVRPNIALMQTGPAMRGRSKLRRRDVCAGCVLMRARREAVVG